MGPAGRRVFPVASGIAHLIAMRGVAVVGCTAW
jgi:hypothetical protein